MGLLLLTRMESSILENDEVIATLERLKQQAKTIEEEVRQSDVVMEEVLQVSAVYRGLAEACSRIYFALEQVSQVHFLYQLSLRFFLEAFRGLLLRNANLEGVEDREERLTILTRDLFSTIFRRVGRGLLHEDQLMFALRQASNPPPPPLPTSLDNV